MRVWGQGLASGLGSRLWLGAGRGSSAPLLLRFDQALELGVAQLPQRHAPELRRLPSRHRATEHRRLLPRRTAAAASTASTATASTAAAASTASTAAACGVRLEA